jgi:hypothetical protein
VEAGEARFDERDLDGSPFIDAQAAMSLSPDKSAPVGDGTELNTPKDALQAKLPLPAHQQKRIDGFSYASLVYKRMPASGWVAQ